MEGKVHLAKEGIDDYNVKSFCGRWYGNLSSSVVTKEAIDFYYKHNVDNPFASHPIEFVSCKRCGKHPWPWA